MFSNYHECYKGTAAYNAATAMPVILENGRKVFGPPHKFSGSRPTRLCELYITRIPTQLDELGFLVWLHRIGPVYAFRLMMDTGNTTRGYAFVRFCSEKDALATIELLRYLYVDGERLGVFRSQDKNRLFISGIPRQLPLSSLEDGFKLCFPKMQSCTAYPPLKKRFGKPFLVRDDEQNRGFAFIEFEDHQMALAAKKRFTPGRVRMWGVDLKIQWAKPKEDMQAATVSKNIHEVSSSTDRYSSPAFSQLNDYCAKLRLYCLANNLCIPVVLYGYSCRQMQLQYAGILIKNSFTGCYTYFIYEVIVHNICDIHILICEVAVKIIEKYSGELQQHNSLVRVVCGTKAELVSTFKDYNELVQLNLKNYFIYDKAITELAATLQMLAQQNHEKILLLYKHSFLTHLPVATFSVDVNNELAEFCSILPKFRNNTKLNNNFNDMEIIILLKSSSLFSSSSSSSSTSVALQSTTSTNEQVSQSNYILRYVDIVGLKLREYYHPAQRVNSNPIWIAGQSYQKSIFN